MKEIVYKAADNWFTNWYDKIQWIQQKIYHWCICIFELIIEIFVFIYRISNYLFVHCLDTLLDRDMADPPDFIDMEPFDDIMSTELGALLWTSMLFSFSTYSRSGPNSGKSYPKFIIDLIRVLFLSFSMSNYSCAKWGEVSGISTFFFETFFKINSKDF